MRMKNAIDIVDRLHGSFALACFRKTESRLHFSAVTHNSGGSNNAFRRSTHSHQRIDARFGIECGDGNSDIAIWHERYPSARITDLLNKWLMSFAIEYADDQFIDILSERFS